MLSESAIKQMLFKSGVLILVLMEYALGAASRADYHCRGYVVLILVLMEYALGELIL